MMPDSTDFRSEICKSLGIGNIAEAHQIIAAGVREGVEALLKRGLNAKTLMNLGYYPSGMEKLGYKKSALERLGYYESKEGRKEPSAEHRRGDETDLKHLIASGYKASKLREKGVTVHDCRKAGYSATESMSLGFSLPDLVSVYSCAELRMAGFGANELRSFFSGQELRNAGFEAREMRFAGFTVRELLNCGYNENNIVTAGFSINELVREGLSKRTKLGLKKKHEDHA